MNRTQFLLIKLAAKQKARAAIQAHREQMAPLAPPAQPAQPQPTQPQSPTPEQMPSEVPNAESLPSSIQR